MSGPKVVRIVTREEIISLCEGHLARLDATIAEWTRIGRRNDCISDADTATVQARRETLRELLAADRFVDLQKQVPLEISFLRDDLQIRLEKVAAEAAKARTAQRRQGDAARALLSALKRAGKAIEPELEQALHGVAAGRSNSSAMTKGFNLLSAAPEANADARYALAQRLKDGEDRMTFAAWLSAQPKPRADPALERLESRLAELGVVAGADVCAPFEAQLRAAIGEAGDARRNLLLDSLGLDLGRTLAEARKRAGLADELRLVFAELEQAGSSALEALSAKRNAATSLTALTVLLDQAQQTLSREREKHGARSRRAAVLKSLSGLGYEVTEGLETAWVEEGRVVLRKTAQPGYGVEIAGDLEVARVQMRAVAFTDGGAGPDSARDKDAETLWCGDVATLQAQLGKGGGGLVIERALAVGATPLKRLVDTGRASRDQSREGLAQQTRTLR
ncbi:MAG: hypothetical protein EOQ56_35515 [Mesorhizobium sp.]|nr:MAG: hypothetical protein EOQ56_35515 [Mesorhizobium sp.]